jgi:uncharacterized protein YhaN
MRFDQLKLTAFGHFSNYEIYFDKNKNFHMFYGPNEAGKSTLLRAISSYLYGIPMRTSDSFRHDNKKLLIEGKLSKLSGDELHFARRKGNKGTVVDVGTYAQLDEKIVSQFLNGISEKDFETIFALNHERLRTGGETLLHSGGNVGEVLFSAASGVSILRQVLACLNQTASNQYTKHARSKSIINQLITREKELAKEIKEHQLKISDWNDLKRKYKKGNEEIEALTLELKELRKKQQKYLRLKQTLPKIALLKNVESRLAELEDIPRLPANVKSLREEYERERDLASENKRKAEKEQTKLKELIENTLVLEDLLAQADKIEFLYRQLHNYQQNIGSISELEGKISALGQLLESSIKKIDTKYHSINQITSYRLTSEQKLTIENLINEKPLIDQKIESKKVDMSQLKVDLAARQDEFGKMGEPQSTEKLENVLNLVKNEGKLEELIEQSRTELKNIELEINNLLQVLPKWEDTLENLLKIKLPALEEIKKRQNEINNLKIEQEKIAALIELEKEKIAEGKSQINNLDSTSYIPTEDELIQARADRTSGWLIIRKKIVGTEVNEEEIKQFKKGLPLEMAYEEKVSIADDISDTMRREAKNLGTKNKILLDIEQSNNRINDWSYSLSELTEKINQWQTDWSILCSNIGIQLETPEEMLEWESRYREIRNFHVNYQKTQHKKIEIENKRTNCLKLILEELSMFENVDVTSSLKSVVTQAENALTNHRDKETKYQVLLEKIKELEENQKHLIKELSFENSKLAIWEDSWRNAIEGLPFTKGIPLPVVKKLIEQYEDCFNKFDELESKNETLAQKRTSVLNFEQEVKSIRQSKIQDLIENSMDIAVSQLYDALTKTREEQIQRKNAVERLEIINSEIKNYTEQIYETEKKLEGLIKLTNCDTIEEFIKVEEQFLEKKDLLEKKENTIEQLIVFGNGLSLEKILDEAKGVDFDSIDSEFRDTECKINEREEIQSVKNQLQGVINKEYEEKITGSGISAIIAEEERQSVLAKLTEATTTYINYKLAATLLQRGIENYRQKNQSPIISRASKLFHKITLGKFDGLTVYYNDKDQPILVGIRNGDEYVEIFPGMSDGTVDQLYLALRIASIELYLQSNEPIPFIVDDILINFDDDRAKITLEILIELSKHTQVFFFTHHNRLIDLLREIASDNLYQIEHIGNTLVAIG